MAKRKKLSDMDYTNKADLYFRRKGSNTWIMCVPDVKDFATAPDWYAQQCPGYEFRTYGWA